MNKKAFRFALKDCVRKIGDQEVRTVEKIHEIPSGEAKYWIQLGNDPATCVWAKETELELVAKAEKPQGEPGLAPSHALME
jgi:hypothetical protein